MMIEGLFIPLMNNTHVGYVDLLLSSSHLYTKPSLPSPGSNSAVYTLEKKRRASLLSNAWQERICIPQNCFKPFNLKRALSFFTCLRMKQFETNLNRYTKKYQSTQTGMPNGTFSKIFHRLYRSLLSFRSLQRAHDHC